MNPPITHPGVLIEHCGSTYTCDPPPTDTDTDFLCLATSLDSVLEFEKLLAKQGWKHDPFYDYIGEFISWKKTIDGVKYNYIVTTKDDWFVSFLKARDLCKKLNLMSKDQRIMVHEAFLEDLEVE